MLNKFNKNKQNIYNVRINSLGSRKSLFADFKTKCVLVFTNFKNKFLANPMLFIFIFSLIISILKGVFSNENNIIT